MNSVRIKYVKITFGHVNIADELVLDYPAKGIDALLFSIKRRQTLLMKVKSIPH